MPLLTERRRGLTGPCLCAAMLLFAGCATQRVRRPESALTAQAQQQVLAAIAGFSLDGRVAVAAGGQGFNATVSWRQVADAARVKLSGPLGAGSLELAVQPGSLQVTTSRGEVLRDDSAAAALTQQLGFVPPLDSLRYWILGLPAPGDSPEEFTRDVAGLPLLLRQQQWQIQYDRFTPVRTGAGVAQLPARLTATRAGLRLRVVVDRWKIG
jgi:outer membrane lipoprotein LolB